MMRNRTTLLAVAAGVLLIAGVWLAMHRSSHQGDLGGGSLFTDLTPALGNVTEVHLSKGDGSHTTLRKDAVGWTVVERQYPADASRVRELVLGLVHMKIIEQKTGDPANYPKLGVEATDSPTATSTLVEVVAGKQKWSLLIGRNAEGRGIYVRKPGEAVSALVEPVVSVDPDQKRWLDRQLADIPAAELHEISVQPASGPAYLLTRAKRGEADLGLSPVPKGRKPASSMSLNGQADSLTGFNFDDVRAAPATPAGGVDRATYRTFDGEVFEFTGHKESDKAYVTVTTSRDEALAAKFAQPAPSPAPTPAASPAGNKPAAATAATPAAAPATPAKQPAKPALATAERLAARGKDVEFEVPLYKYETLFKPLEGLLEPKPEPAPQAGNKGSNQGKPADRPKARPAAAQ